MPRRVAMSVIRTRCRQRADIEGDNHISDAEINALISEKYGELYGLIVEAGLRYFETTQTITATGAASYTEPSDHLQTVGLDYVSSDGSRRALLPLMPHERANLAGQSGDAIGYTLVDDQIRLYPNPTSGTYEMLYVPQAPDLSSYADADLVDLFCPDGEAFLIWGVTVMAKSKSESDVRLAMEREAAARDRTLFWATQRQGAEPLRRAESAWEGEWWTARGWWGG